jgi:hypothetical protein
MTQREHKIILIAYEFDIIINFHFFLLEGNKKSISETGTDTLSQIIAIA